VNPEDAACDGTKLARCTHGTCLRIQAARGPSEQTRRCCIRLHLGGRPLRQVATLFAGGVEVIRWRSSSLRIGLWARA